jgi:hypothetical protein
MSPVKAGLWPMLAATALLTACGNSPAGPPSAQDILNRPNQANVKDAHFTLVAHIVTGNISFDATGDGVLVIKPTQASKFTMETSVSGQKLKFEEIIVGGNEYDLSPDNPRWTKQPATANPGSFKGTKVVYLGETNLKNGKAWHVKATDDNGNPFEAWVRESDGYPLKYAITTQGTTFTASFDRFNTGETVTAPPASDIQQ